MTGLLIALAMASALACSAVVLRRAFARTRPAVLLEIVHPLDAPESVEAQLTADLLDGAIGGAEYRAALTRLAASEAAELAVQ
jgi:hypothetical protein